MSNREDQSSLRLVVITEILNGNRIAWEDDRMKIQPFTRILVLGPMTRKWSLIGSERESFRPKIYNNTFVSCIQSRTITYYIEVGRI